MNNNVTITNGNVLLGNKVVGTVRPSASNEGGLVLSLTGKRSQVVTTEARARIQTRKAFAA